MKVSALLSILKVTLICMSLSLLESHAATAIAKPLSDSEILSVLTERIDVEKQGVAIVVGIIDGEGTRVISHGFANKKMQVAADANSVFEIGSITKVFTSLILADMVEKDEVKLTDPVAMYLPKSVTVPRAC